MPVRRLASLLLLCLAARLLIESPVLAQEETVLPAGVSGPLSAATRAIIDQARRAVVVISVAGREGKTQALGSGFILQEDGLVATNLHVIGEARPISVRLFDGRKFDVRQVFATDKTQDLALLKIDAEGLPTLALGDSDALAEGEPLIAIGNPEGLEHSVVTGVSAVRKDFEGMDLIQLAMPIERGNSGGPVLNGDGEVIGLVTMKHLLTRNLGFAVASNRLKPLLEKPNPIAMSKWLTIGVINRRLWETPGDDAHWTQRAGLIKVSGVGDGFGGRSICLSRSDPPELPCEVGVFVRIEEEDGAAGLVFHSDGGEKHFGFYPSSGKLRLTRFDGPTVYQWNVLNEVRSPHLRPAEWNYLKVRVEADGFRCYCNDALIFESKDKTYTSGRAGLAKFRHTTAEFKQFRIGAELPASQPSDELIEQLATRVEDIDADHPPRSSLVDSLLTETALARSALENRAKLLERQAVRLRQLSAALHAERVRKELVQALDHPGDDTDLLHAVLLVSALDNPDLDVDLYRQEVEAMAKEFVDSLPADVSEADRLEKFNRYVFQEQGFHGSRTDYYAASNSYLNEVIDDREGLPITLSVLYLELARRCGLTMVGIGLPGHFVVQHRPREGEGKPQLLDPFNAGKVLSELEATLLVKSITGLEWNERYLEPQPPRAVVERVLRNLLNVANGKQDAESALRYLDTVLALDPENPGDRLFKAVLCLKTGRYDEGIAEVDWVLEREPEEVAIEQVHRLREALESMKTEGD